MSIRIISAEEAATYIKNGDNIGVSGFTAVGCPKAVGKEIAKIADAEHAKGNPLVDGKAVKGYN